MNRLDNIWNDLQDKKTDIQVLNFWEERQKRILESLETVESNKKAPIIYKLVKALNETERYSSVYYLYTNGYLSFEDKLNGNKELLNELKYEFGRGLHHNRKYEHSKRLFNELAASGFDTNRIEDWWDQTAFASIRDKVWIKTDVLPAIIRFVLMIGYILIAIKTKEILISTTLFILLSEILDTWWYQFRVTKYLEEYGNNQEIGNIKRNIKKKIIIELLISLLFYPIYFLKQEWLIPLIFILAVYFHVFHYGLNYYYLPRLIGNLNRENAQPPTMHHTA